MLGGDDCAARRVDGVQRALRLVHPPRVAEPQRRQEVHRRRVAAAVGERDPDVDVVGRALGVLDVDVDVAVVVEDAGVEQLVLQLEPASGTVRGDEIGVRELAQRVAVAVLQVRARRRGVEVEVVLLHVLAVVALGVRQAEHPLLQDRVDPVPQRDREAQALVVVAEAGDAVLAPLVGTRASLVVAEVVPRVAVVAVVLPDRAPLPLAQVRPPPLPRSTGARLLQAIRFDSLRHRHPDRSCCH